MAKSMRSKKLKRLRAIRREMVEPFYDGKDVAKLAAQAAALAAPKLPAAAAAAAALPNSSSTSMATAAASSMDVEMADDNQNKSSLKPAGGVGKKSKKNFKVGKNKRSGKGKFRRKRNI